MIEDVHRTVDSHENAEKNLFREPQKKIIFFTCDFKQFGEKYDNYRSIVFSRVIDCLLTKIFVWLLNFEETQCL